MAGQAPSSKAMSLFWGVVLILILGTEMSLK
jgi:hypothetical protein